MGKRHGQDLLGMFHVYRGPVSAASNLRSEQAESAASFARQLKDTGCVTYRLRSSLCAPSIGIQPKPYWSPIVEGLHLECSEHNSAPGAASPYALPASIRRYT
jgi:hypothetical protein